MNRTIKDLQVALRTTYFLIITFHFIRIDKNFILYIFFSEEADLLARALGCKLIHTSVKEDVNVAAVFRHLASKCLAEIRDPLDDYFMSPTTLSPNSLTISKYY